MRSGLLGTETPPSTADHAIVLANRAWGTAEDTELWGRFAPAWQARLLSIGTSIETISAQASFEALRSEHRASGRSDPSRIHPSWYVRALRAESPAVRRAVAEHAPEPIREILRTDLGLGPDSTRPDFPADPEALNWALALWTERLIGDLADRENDPPVVVAVTRLTPRDLARLIKACGQVKHAFAIEGTRPPNPIQEPFRVTPMDRVRIGFFRRLIGTADTRLILAARADLESIGEERNRAYPRLGLLTVGRILGDVEPYRSRWALQHLPYPIARRMREKTLRPLPTRALVAWESWNLEAAWARLLSEGRLVGRRGGSD